MLVSDAYDKETNQTSLTLLPYGTITIPGQWTKTSYNEVSRQHFFIDTDSTSIAVTKNPQEKYPFYRDNLTDVEFAEKFFEWEREFYEKRSFLIDRQGEEGQNYVLWKASGENANTLFLYGAKNGFAYNFAVFSDNWSDEKRVEFVKKLFEEN